MFAGGHRDLALGRAAWLRGDLDDAVERLRAASDRREACADPLYTLALALSERGDVAAALETLERAESAAADPGPPRLFRAVVLYDHGRDLEAQECLGAVHPTNIIARGLSALIAFRRSPDSTRVVLARGARWMAEVAGRLFAIIDTRFFERAPEEAVRFQQDALALHETSRDPAEVAFAEGRHEEAARLFAEPGAGRPDERAVRRAFSLLALGREAASLRALDEARLAGGWSEDVHFVRGVHHARFGRPREAGWAFVRAARLADVVFDGIVMDGAKKIGVELELSDAV